MAEERVTQVGAEVEVSGSAAYVTQSGALVEVAGNAAYVTQFGALVEIVFSTERVTQFGVLVEIDYIAPPDHFGGAAAAPSGASTKPVKAVSARAAGFANALFATLAASRASQAAGTRLSSGAPSGGLGVGEVRSIVAQVYVWWDGTNLVEETDHFISARGTQSLAAPEQLLAGGKGAVASCQITLSNHDSRYSPQNDSSLIHDDIAAGATYLRKVLVLATLADVATYTVFTGVIREMTEAAPTSTQPSTVVLECRSRDELILQDKRSTALADFTGDSTQSHAEDYHITNLLTRAGMVDGTDFRSQTYATANGLPPTIDPGIFPLRYVWLDDESVLDEIWNLIAACCGWFYCDHVGLFHYHNITGVLAAALQRQYNAMTTVTLTQAQAAGLQLSWPTAELYGEVTVEVAPRAPGEIEEIWRPDDVVVVQPSQTKIIWARLSAPLTSEPTVAWLAFTAGGVAITTGLAVTQELFAQRVKLTIANTGTKAAYFRTLTLTGQTLSGGRTVEVNKVSTNAFWTARPKRKRTISGNPYIQSESQAETIAAYLLKRQELPTLMATVPNLDRADVRLGWPITVEWTGSVPTAGKISGLVSGVSWGVDATGFHQDVEILETGTLYASVSPWFTLGTNKLGAVAGALEGYLFY